MNNTELEEAERHFRAGLADAARHRPSLGPIDLDALREGASGGRRPPVAWLAAAAVLVLVVGVGLGVNLLAGQRSTLAGPAAHPVALVGTVWRLDAIDSTPAVGVTDAGPYLIFDDQNQVTGSTGCTSLHARYTLDQQRLSVSDLSSVPCPESSSMSRQTVRIIEALADVERLDLAGDRLSLLDASGTRLLVFVADPTADPTAMPVTDVQIRLRNDSSAALEGVLVTFGDGTSVRYGTVAPGRATDYRYAGKEAYAYASVRASVGGRDAVLQPIDYVGETPLKAGRYTYVLTYADRSLGLELQVDR